ncbi:MAG: dTDP-4-dehydrorhamnose 3,5-epimerase [Candidatus Competibacteraceae bacterium]|nr:dTDP-4-dehydrorhamnose 3,5-epimerase [Candidatus Competibacteraceae bacterium]
MKIDFTDIKGLAVITPQIFADERGYFLETYHHEKLRQLIYPLEFVQDNESSSTIHTLRGLHFQIPPFAQGKLVRVIRGKALDVAVDLRKSSPTYGQYFSIWLDDISKQQLWIPPGFAHGFLAADEGTLFAYKCTAYYQRDAERCIRWNDTNLSIDWGVDNPLVSIKDNQGMDFKMFDSPFI